MSSLHSYCYLVILLSLGAASTSASSIVPGAFWTDTLGVPIQAHGGGFLKLGSNFYWFGEDKTENSHHFRHINSYRSSDLITWEFLGHALSATNGTSPVSEIGPDAVVERPKVIYNELTQKFVMWFHLDSANYGLAKLGLAISSNVQGPYEYLGSISPFGEDSRDMTVWVDLDDPERPAYLVYATRVNLDTVIAKLSSDYLRIEERLVKLEGIHQEAYAVFKKNGLFYLVTSGATGWDPNSNSYMYSRNMSGPWSARQSIAPDSTNTFSSQSNYVIPLPNGQFIYAGDRWNRYALSDSRYMWLPITFGENNAIEIKWKSQWWVNTTSGTTGESSSKTIKAGGTSATLIGSAVVQSCSGCTDGKSVGYIGYTGRIRFDGIHANRTSDYSIIVSYTNGDSAPRFLYVNVNGRFLRLITFPSSPNGQAPTQLVFQTQLNEGNENSLEFFYENAWGPDLDYISVQCYFVNC